MKRINVLMVFSFLALILAFLSLVLSLILHFSIAGKLNKFMKEQLIINNKKFDTLNEIKEMKDTQKKIIDIIDEYAKEYE